MTVDISSSFKKNPPKITLLKPGYLYTDGKGVDYIFLGYGGYNVLLNKEYTVSSPPPPMKTEDWKVISMEGNCPFDYKGIPRENSEEGSLYLYLRAKKVANVFKGIPNTYEELLQTLVNFDGIWFVYGLQKPRNFVEEKGQVITGIEEVNEKMFKNSSNTVSYDFRFTEK